MIKAILFDMDGVLYDSMPFHVRAWSEIASGHQLVHTPDNFYLWEGRTADSTVNLLFTDTYGRNATPEEVKEIYAEKALLFNKYNDGHTVAGVKEVLKQVKELNLDTLIVTGSGQHSLLEKLEVDFPGYFRREKMVTGFDVQIGKPHPEPYLMGLEKAGITASEAIVIENAPLGVQSAKSAGIFTVAVNTGPLPDYVLRDSGADVVYSDMYSLATDLLPLVSKLNLL